MKIGVYYDDPETVPEDQLRFAVGVIMAQSKFYNFKQCRGHGKFKNYG